MICWHLFVDGFGGMGDALTCAKCGLCKYPEAIPVASAVATISGRIIRESHPQYKEYFNLATQARREREERETL